jgi:hypothetical protein
MVLRRISPALLKGWTGLLILLMLLTGTQAQGQTKMTKQDFSARGFSIVLPDEPTFAGELRALGFSSPSTPEDVVVKNTSQRYVAAFGIRFLYRFADGTSAPFSSIIALFPQALSDPAQTNRQDREPLIAAGGALLVSPEGDGIVSLTSSPVAVSVRVTPSKPVTGIRVEANAVVFADGGVWGPDDMQVAQQLQSKLNVQQVLIQEISQRMANGEQLGTVLRDMTGSVPSADMRNKLFDTVSLYSRFREDYLRQLTSTYRRNGDVAAKDRLEHFTFRTMPNIHQEGGN